MLRDRPFRQLLESFGCVLFDESARHPWNIGRPAARNRAVAVQQRCGPGGQFPSA
jgi:hypothetical protein